jgi:hypothetical protein
MCFQGYSTMWNGAEQILTHSHSGNIVPPHAPRSDSGQVLKLASLPHQQQTLWLQRLSPLLWATGNMTSQFHLSDGYVHTTWVDPFSHGGCSFIVSETTPVV